MFHLLQTFKILLYLCTVIVSTAQELLWSAGQNVWMQDKVFLMAGLKLRRVPLLDSHLSPNLALFSTLHLSM